MNLSFKPRNSLLILSMLLLGLNACKKDIASKSNPPHNGPEQGYATGKVVNGQGSPMGGAHILLDNTLLYASYIYGTTEEDGTYKIKVADGVWKAFATIEKTYNGRTYELDLQPDNNNSFGTEGAVRNFTWKLSGKVPGELYYYGGFIQLTNSTQHNLDFTYVELVLTPTGPMIDGSSGQTLRLRKGSENWKNYYEIQDIPIGRYKVTAFYKTTQGDIPLTLQNWVTKDGFVRELILDFDPDPSFTSVKNAASIEIGE